MKKMTLIAAVVVVAGMAQASSITWAFSGIQAVAGGSIAANGQGFAFTGAANRAAVVALLAGADTSNYDTLFAAFQTGLLNSQAGTTPLQSIGANSNVALGGKGLTTAAGAFLNGGATGSYGGVAARDAFAASTVQSVFVVIFNNADWTAATHYTISGLNTQALAAFGAKNYATTWANWGGTGVTGTWTEIVPEPTSMALLALGVAAIGLRRKNRK